MKRIKTLLIIMFVLFIPKTIYGLNASISCSRLSLEVGESTQCSVSVTSEEGITSFNGEVSGNSNLEVSGGLLSHSSEEPENSFSLSGITVKALSAGTGVLTLTGDASDSVSIEISEPEAEVLLSSLTVPGEILSPSFDSSVKNYSLTTNKDSIIINATATNGSVILDGVKKTLVDGLNTFEIPVGNTKYTLSVTKTSQSDNLLKSLSLSSGTINFSPSELNYNVELSSDVSSVKVTAEANSNATIKYNPSDSVTLKYGETKVISIVVTSSNGTITTYKINVTRKNLDSGASTSLKSTSLKSLTIEGATIKFDPEKVTYNINVPNSMEEAIINYELADSTSTAKIDGDTKLKVGKNKIKIIVTASNGKTNTYTLNITRNKSRVSVINDEEKIIESISGDDKSDLYVNITSDDEKIITKGILEALSKTEKELSYEILNDNRELLYSITLNGKDVKNTDAFNYQLSLISDNDDKLVKLIKSNKYVSVAFKNNSNIPGKMLIKVYVGDRTIRKSKTLDLYEYSNDKLKLVEKNVKINEGYIEFTMDDNVEYVLTKFEKVKKSTTSYTIPIVIILTLLVFVGIVLLLRKRKSNKE